MAEFLQLLVSGLATGGIYALVAVGFTLLWQTSQTINFAQGEFVMLPVFFALVAMGSIGAPLPVAMLVAVLCSLLVLGVIFKFGIVDPLLKQGTLPLVISTIGLSIFFKEAVKKFYSAEPHTFPSMFPDVTWGKTLGIGVSAEKVGVLLVATIAILVLSWFLASTKTGRQMQATAQNPTVARILGVNVNRMVLYTFLINAALAALASLLISPSYFATFGMGEELGLVAFVAAIVGGFNQVRGAIVGGLLIGVVDNLAGFMIPSYRKAVPLVLLVLIILIRPQGLLGRREERAV